MTASRGVRIVDESGNPLEATRWSARSSVTAVRVDGAWRLRVVSYLGVTDGRYKATNYLLRGHHARSPSSDAITRSAHMKSRRTLGLGASVFTRDLDRAMSLAQLVHTGNVHINGGPNWRVDHMPYGGFGQSGFGKEGVRYSVEEMTETKMVVVHPGQQHG